MKPRSVDDSLADRLATLAQDWKDVSATHSETPIRAADLDSCRAQLHALAQEAESADRAALGQALRRVALLSEVWECLRSEPGQEEAANEVASFCSEAMALLADVEGARSADEQAAQSVLRRSGERWSEYLTLVDPDSDQSEQAVEPESFDLVFPDQPDEPPAIDAQALLRLFSSGDRREPIADAPVPLPQIPALPLRLDLDAEMRDAFLADASELFERIENLVVGLNTHSDARGAIHELARCFHTLKGAAGSVGLRELAELIHALEEQIERAAGRVSPGLNDLLHQVVAYLDGLITLLRRKEVAAAPKCRPNFPEERSAVVTQEPGETAGHAQSSALEGPIRVPAARFDELTDLAGELIVQARFWLSQAELIRTFAATVRASRNRLLASTERLHEIGTEREGRLLRAPADHQADLPAQLGRLAEQADDMTVLADTAQAAAASMADRADALLRLSHQLWDSFQSLRIVPIRGLFHRVSRVLYDAARVEGRQVEVVMLGEETGVDRGIQDKAFEPLLHVARNAVGHGIESPDERASAGKAAAGRVTLEARRAGNTLMIAVQDDGKGLDSEAIAAKARRLGWLAPDETPSPERLHEFIFQPGFSTKTQANAISGRGVGMDVVAREVSKLRGTIGLSSRPGHGARVTLQLPSQLALEPALIVRVAGQGYAIPASQIESAQSFEPPIPSSPPDETESGGSSTSTGATVVFRDQPIPLVFARDMLGIERNTSHPWPKLVVVRTGSRLVGVVVDAIEGTEDLVIKPLGALLGGHPLVSGTSLSLNGELISIINPTGFEAWLIHHAGAEMVHATAAPAQEPRIAARAETTVLVVDDSISVRRGMARHLCALGLDVHEVSDGMEALSRLRSSSYGLVVTDLEMPRLDGFALLAEMKRVPALAAIPVVVASTLGGADTRRRVLELGARALLAKPVDPRELARAVEPLLPCGER
jgi:chemotaxis protein histidine kinase CheA